MIRNEYVYELSPAQVASFDLSKIAEIAALRAGPFTYLTQGHAYIAELATRFPSFQGISIREIGGPDAINHTFTDQNMLNPSSSRLSSINFVVGSGAVTYEWWTGNGAMPGWAFGTFQNENYPLAGNTKLFDLVASVPMLIDVASPHVLHSDPAGAVVVSVGFTQDLADMIPQLQA